MKSQKLLRVVPIAVLVLSAFFVMMPAQATVQAAATGASLELASNSFLEGSPLTVRVFDVTAAGGSIGIAFYYDNAGTPTLEAKSAYANRSVQLGTGQTEWVITMIFESPTAGAWIRVRVLGSNTGTTTQLAEAQVDAIDPTDLLPTDLIITIGVALMIILIVVGIVAGLARRGRA